VPLKSVQMEAKPEPEQISPEQISEEFHQAIHNVRVLLARLHEEVSLAERGGFEPPVEL
jgi:hypothetical protein